MLNFPSRPACSTVLPINSRTYGLTWARTSWISSVVGRLAEGAHGVDGGVADYTTGIWLLAVVVKLPGFAQTVAGSGRIHPGREHRPVATTALQPFAGADPTSLRQECAVNTIASRLARVQRLAHRAKHLAKPWPLGAAAAERAWASCSALSPSKRPAAAVAPGAGRCRSRGTPGHSAQDLRRAPPGRRPRSR